MCEDNKDPSDTDEDWNGANLDAYRQELVSAEQVMQSAYDKAVLTLSGGALGISFTFLKNVIGDQELVYYLALIGAWALWGISITAILASFFTSSKALRKAIVDTDFDRIYQTLAKSGWSTATKWLNAIGGACFILGVFSLLVFIANNQPNIKSNENETQAASEKEKGIRSTAATAEKKES